MAPNPQEPGPYGIGSDLWPGVGKLTKEMSELGVVLGKLFGSGGDRNHWSGDLLLMMRDEIADVRAALDFLEDVNPVLTEETEPRLSQEAGFSANVSGRGYIRRRRDWKRDLFQSWHDGDPQDRWPKPEAYGLPPRAKAP